MSFLSFDQLLNVPLIPFLLFSLLLIPLKWLLTTSKTQKNSLPSVPRLPIIGNLHQLGSIPHLALWNLAQKYGQLMMIHLGSVPMLVVSSANGAKEILKTQDLVFSNRPKLSVPDKLTYGSKDIGFAPYGEYWRQIKSISVIHLLSRKQVLSFRQVREKETTRMLENIGKCVNGVADLSEMLVVLTNNIICEVALGRTYSDMKFKDLLVKFQNLLGTMTVGGYVPWLSWVDKVSGLERRTKAVAKELDAFFDAVLEEHIRKRKMEDGGNKKSNADHEGQDLVDILLDLQKENASNFVFGRETIKAIISDIFSGGTDTTSATIEWALSELISHPYAMKKLQAEVAKIGKGKPMITEDDLQDMDYLKAVMKETLRLHVPLPLLVPHESVQDVKVMGHHVAKGTQVMINAWAIARDPSIWEDPEEFKPERFLNSSIDYKGFDFELLPFGAGRRGCPGTFFAIIINELALANIVYKYDLALPNGEKPEKLDMSETIGLVVHKSTPLLVAPTPRF